MIPTTCIARYNLDNFHPIELGAVIAVSLDSALSDNHLASWDCLAVAEEHCLIVTSNTSDKEHVPLLAKHATDNLNSKFDLITNTADEST